MNKDVPLERREGKEIDYTLLDSGLELKWEQFGPYSLIRPAAVALWQPLLKSWKADALFSREGKKEWTLHRTLPSEWTCSYEGLLFKIKLTDFGHVGLFPEHAYLWKKCAEMLAPKDQVLNLFAYSGGATLYFAKRDIGVCHLDSSKGMVDWARQNAELNQLQDKPVRWIVEDALKYLRREKTRGRLYDAILMDPPSFGRGSQGEVFKIEKDLPLLIAAAKELLSPKRKFFCISCHTPGFTPQILSYLLKEHFPEDLIEMGELILPSKAGHPLASGVYALVNFQKTS